MKGKASVFFGVVGLAFLIALPAAGNAKGYGPPVVVPVKANPAGQTYGRWAAEWWQWALGIPADVNPVVDTNGEFCTQRQVDDVWFLAGAFTTDPVIRF
jgi:hypothetical protein